MLLRKNLDSNESRERHIDKKQETAGRDLENIPFTKKQHRAYIEESAYFQMMIPLQAVPPRQDL